MSSQVDKLVFGIAGNSPGYLAQTGEIKAFSQEVAEQNGPKALFPIYVAEHASFLGTQPFSSDSLHLPKEVDAVVQMEPELAVKYRVQYHTDGSVSDLKPYALTVINDVTYRNRDITKLAEKKNWGECSKGISNHELMIDSLEPGGDVDQLRLCGFYKRNGQWRQCSEDVATSQYIVFYQVLTDWVRDRINQQQSEGVLHNALDLVHVAGKPDSITVAIGAPSYTELEAKHQLRAGDEIVVCLYQQSGYQLNDLPRVFDQTEDTGKPNPQMILLKQTVSKHH
ncbi:hypothetical protein THF1D04_10891 [Vibrio owensii]|uniref:Uncharacterized protein n=1 Tax=Vibrio owensii TaxID=696485 RepID=A0AAU9PZA7_9VIBR|nr:hypothetical protein THF1D04_10891 [Vibrio owensii]